MSGRVSALVVAAGGSRRMGFDKLLATLGGKPVLLRTLLAFENCESVDEIVVVAGGDLGWNGARLEDRNYQTKVRGRGRS